MSAFGPGSAFASFSGIGSASNSQRPVRGRVASSGSFKDLTQPSSSANDAAGWESSGGGDNQVITTLSGTAGGPAQATVNGNHSSDPTSRRHHDDAHDKDRPAKPFVYSREFLLSLYDDEKAAIRPVELSPHAVATLEQARRPWALRDWKEGEKELFNSSIHPPNMRVNNRNQQTSRHAPAAANDTSNTLDLASLGTLPRDRDRERMRSSTAEASTSASVASAEDPNSALRRAKSVRSGGSISSGIFGGVLGGIAPPPARRREGSVDKGAQSSEEAGSPSTSIAKESALNRWRTSSNEPAADTLAVDKPLVQLEDEPQKPSQQVKEQQKPGFVSLFDDDPLLGSIKQPSTSQSATPTREASPPPVAADPNWQYRDPSGQIQGPFSADVMHSWYRQQFFSGDLLVKRASDPDFEPLEELIRRCGSAEQPFIDGSKLARTKPTAPHRATETEFESINVAQSPVREARPGLSALQDLHSPVQERNAPQQHDQSRHSSYGQAIPSSDPWATLNPAQLQETQQQQQQQQLSEAARRDAGANLLAQLQRAAQTSPFEQQQQQPRIDLVQQLLAQQQQFQHPHQQQHPFQMQQPQFFGIPGSLAPQQFSAANAPLPPPIYQGDFAGFSRGPPQQPAWQMMQPQMQQSQQQYGSGMNQMSSPPHMPAQQPLSSPAQMHAQYATPQAPQPVTSPWHSAEPASVPVTEARDEQGLAQQHHRHVEQQQAADGWLDSHGSPQQRHHPSVSAAPEIKSPAEQVAALPSIPAEDEAPAHPAKPAAPAPWLKAEEEKPSSSTPSLREIQEMEAKAAKARRAAEKEAQARAQEAAAQRAAQQAKLAEAESLPASSTWATTGPTPTGSPTTVKSGVSAPWLSKTGSSSGKTLKEIQEEEERERQKAAAQAAAAQQAVGAGPRGYAQLAAKPQSGGSGWTTVAVKPPPAATSAPKQRPIIPGLTPAATAAGSSTKVATPAASSVRPAAPAKTASVPATSSPSATRTQTTQRAAAAPTYDADNPPPPSGEFMKWCRDALHGLNVPMDEFIQMLLSFPLNASSDVLEIISDSVYANSSTLDGRRFANEFTSRRKLDVAARYPQIVAGGKMVQQKANGTVSASGVNGPRAGSMADALKMPVQPKQAEWSVPVGKKKAKKT